MIRGLYKESSTNSNKMCGSNESYKFWKLLTNRLDANWRTRETFAMSVACRLGRLKLKAVPTGDFGSAPLPVKKYYHLKR